MKSNGNHHFVQNVFSLQTNGAGAETLDASVRQDKVRTSSVRPATRQPVRDANRTRTAAMTGKYTRSKNTPTSKKQRVLVGVWVEPVVKAELQRLAEQEGLTISATGAAFLTQALQNNVDIQYSALLQPIIENAIRKEMKAIATRLAWLLVRVAFDTGQTRSLDSFVESPVLEAPMTPSSGW